MKIIYFELIFLLIIFNLSLCIIVFPFKSAYVNKNGDIDQTKKEYNYTHFMNDYFERFLYTTLEIGNPPQKIKVILTYQDCGFKIGLAKRCIYEEEYLSHYNKNDSSDFYYTDKYIYNIMEFDKGHSAADSIKLYKDINLKQYENFKSMDFYLGTDTDESLCGVIGFKMDRSEYYCRNISIIRNFKSNNMIDNYKWTLKYNSDDEGIIIFGTNMNEIIKNYNENYLYNVQSRYLGGGYPWCFDIHLLTIYGDKNMTFEGSDRWIEINNDITFLIGNSDFENYIQTLANKIGKEISEENVNSSVKRILELKERNGLLEPYISPNLEENIKNAKDIVSSKDNHNKELEIAKKAVTMIKNDNNTLPIDTKNKTVILYEYATHVNAINNAIILLKNDGNIINESNIKLLPIKNTE